MQYKESPLDRFLQQRISDNAKELKNTLMETLQEEQQCLEEIRFSINHCKENLVACEKLIKKHNGYSSKMLVSKNRHSKIILIYGTYLDIYKWRVLK